MNNVNKNRNSATSSVIVWFRCDLRLADNPALNAAVQSGLNIIPLYIWAPDTEGPFGSAGTASEVWLADSLKDLSKSLERLGSTLIIRRGNGEKGYLEEILSVAEAFQCRAVYSNRRYEPHFKIIDGHIEKHLGKVGIESLSFNGSLLYEPTSISLDSDKWHGHWGTLMPFFKACQTLGPPARETSPPLRIKSLPRAAMAPYSLSVEGAGLAKMPVVNGRINDWAAPIRSAWLIGEEHAQNELRKYIRDKLRYYEDKRSRTDVLYVSRLSPYIRWGQLSPHALYWAVKDSGIPIAEVKTFARRLFWRDLAYFHLYAFPDMTHVSIRKHYEGHKWSSSDSDFEAWKTGNTGYPMVDAGMRELYTTGWMHQNVRMVCASFLTEYLNQHWRRGHDWFIHTLVDADVAINAMMWQNAGRSGVDQWNFLSSPESGSQDPSGSYTRTWCPELANLTGKSIHKPWEISSKELLADGVVLGQTYPIRIVTNLTKARAETKAYVIEMRQRSMQFNDPMGYDLITLPSGAKTRVFTKEEYRLDRSGNIAVVHKRPRIENSTEKGKNPRGKSDKGSKKKEESDKLSAEPVVRKVEIAQLLMSASRKVQLGKK